MIYTKDFGSGTDKTPKENREALDRAVATLPVEGGTVMLSAGVFWGLTARDNVTFVGERRPPGGPYPTHIHSL